MGRGAAMQHQAQPPPLNIFMYIVTLSAFLAGNSIAVLCLAALALACLVASHTVLLLLLLAMFLSLRLRNDLSVSQKSAANTTHN